MALIALATIATFLIVTVYSVVNDGDGEITKQLVQTLVTVGVSGVFAYFFTRDRA